MAHRRIHQLVNLRNRERILWASFVQVCKIYTYAPLPSLLLYHYSVSQPFMVKKTSLITPACLCFITSSLTASECSLDKHQGGCILGVTDGLTFR